MSSLRDIRRQIHSVENIQKITTAMERVAAVHLRRMQKKTEARAPYIAEIRKILDQVASGDIKHPLFEKRKVKKTGLVVIASDKGLAGSFNSAVFSYADNFLQKYVNDTIELILIGRKGIDHYIRRNWNIRLKLEGGGATTFIQIKELSDQLIRWFLDGCYDEVWIIYTQYISLTRKSIVAERFLPIGKPSGVDQNYLFEPNVDEILADLLPRYSAACIQEAIGSSTAAELSARIVAMQTASKNSREMIGGLTLTKNKIRQRDITREMIEITSGAKD